jgi:hypothetical protein
MLHFKRPGKYFEMIIEVSNMIALLNKPAIVFFPAMISYFEVRIKYKYILNIEINYTFQKFDSYFEV